MQMMDPRRKSLSDVPESSELSSILERSPLLDRRSSKSTSISHLHKQPPGSRIPYFGNNLHRLTPLKPIFERASSSPSLSRSRSVEPLPRYPPSARASPFYRCGVPTATLDHAQFRSSPQYRVNPVVKFDERLVPVRMNYGIGGYNTSRRERRGPGVVMRVRPKTVHVLRLWTRRLRVRMMRVGVGSAYSRLMMRFRRRW